ncbi:helix-turn-helix domain-containing GNAT family N-acetyltransferase [soil metagenome]
MQSADRIRHFNRFYTRHLGVLSELLLHSDFGLTEARILFELARRETVSAKVLASGLGLDAGYLSRVLKSFEGKRLIRRTRSTLDARQHDIALTEKGKATFAPLDKASAAEAKSLLRRLSTGKRARLLEAMETIEEIVAGTPLPAITLRPPRPGDLGWIVHRHGVLYAQEYHFDARFEALVAGIVASFVETFKPTRECCLVAAAGTRVLGSVFVVEEDAATAKLRLLYVEPAARGLGLGRRLAGAAIAFARDAGYSRMTLWTNDILHAARRIYETAGFRLMREEKHESFGQELTGQYWELQL